MYNEYAHISPDINDWTTADKMYSNRATSARHRGNNSLDRYESFGYCSLVCVHLMSTVESLSVTFISDTCQFTILNSFVMLRMYMISQQIRLFEGKTKATALIGMLKSIECNCWLLSDGRAYHFIIIIYQAKRTGRRGIREKMLLNYAVDSYGWILFRLRQCEDWSTM